MAATQVAQCGRESLRTNSASPQKNLGIFQVSTANTPYASGQSGGGDLSQRPLDHRWTIFGRGDFSPKPFDPENLLQCRNGTRLWFFDDESGELIQATSLPYWGDCGQPAFLVTPEGDQLVAYYRCQEMIDQNLSVGGGPHPGKYSFASIYLARMVID